MKTLSKTNRLFSFDATRTTKKAKKKKRANTQKGDLIRLLTKTSGETQTASKVMSQNTIRVKKN
jgi:hypothetical protein